MTTETFTYIWDGKLVHVSPGDPAVLDKIDWIRKALGGLESPTVEPYFALGRFDTPNSDLRVANLVFRRKDGTGRAAVDLLLTDRSPTRSAHSINLELGNGNIGDPRPMVDPAIIGEYAPPKPPKVENDWEAAGSPMGGPIPGAAGCFYDIMSVADVTMWTGPSGKVYEPGYWFGSFSKERPSMFATPCWKVKANA